MYHQLILAVQLAGVTRRIIVLEPLGDSDVWEEQKSVQKGIVDNRLESVDGRESLETYI